MTKLAIKSPRAKRVPLSERKLAYAVLTYANLKNIRLANCSVKHNFTASHVVRSVTLEVSAQGTISVNDKRLNVNAHFKIIGTPHNTPSESLTVECTFVLDYDLDTLEGLNENNFRAFTQWIGLNNAWPYAREFIQNMTSRLGLLPLKLPLFKSELADGGVGLISMPEARS